MKEKQTVIRKNPVVRTGKWAIALMKNKLAASLMLLIQGILFILAPQGDMTGTVRIAAAVVILTCTINILMHLMQKNKGVIHYLLAFVNALLTAAAVFCLVSPQTVEPSVRPVIGAVTALTGLVNLVETLKIEKRKSWQFAVGVMAAIVIMGLGIAMMIAGAAKVELIQQSGGIFLILSALINIWYIIRLKQA